MKNIDILIEWISFFILIIIAFIFKDIEAIKLIALAFLLIYVVINAILRGEG